MRSKQKCLVYSTVAAYCRFVLSVGVVIFIAAPILMLAQLHLPSLHCVACQLVLGSYSDTAKRASPLRKLRYYLLVCCREVELGVSNDKLRYAPMRTRFWGSWMNSAWQSRDTSSHVQSWGRFRKASRHFQDPKAPRWPLGPKKTTILPLRPYKGERFEVCP